jgi:pyruvyltransferase
MEKFIRAFFYSSNNFGDNLNHFLIKSLSGLPCIYNERDKPHYIVCGSILSEANHLTTVWGAGFGGLNNIFSMKMCANVKMVRGIHSAQLIGMDFDIYGDPALLLPLFYNPVVKKKHRYGVIPHWKDHELARTWLNAEKYHIIDPFLPVKEFVDEILSCEQVACSGLHGLIVADAYKVPNVRFSFGTDIGGDGIKFHDYYSTTKTGEPPHPVADLLQDWPCAVHEYRFSIDDLLKSCPFYNGTSR